MRSLLAVVVEEGLSLLLPMGLEDARDSTAIVEIVAKSRVVLE
jgi:hypothetical protein